mgnify:CR=1 FL=1
MFKMIPEACCGTYVRLTLFCQILSRLYFFSFIIISSSRSSIFTVSICIISITI